jgi:hypothetical protein
MGLRAGDGGALPDFRGVTVSMVGDLEADEGVDCLEGFGIGGKDLDFGAARCVGLEEHKKRGTCTTAELVDFAVIGLRAEARPPHSVRVNMECWCLCKLQMHKYLLVVIARGAPPDRPGKRWLLRYWPEVTLHF